MRPISVPAASHSAVVPLRHTDVINATWYFDFISPFAYLQLRARFDIAPRPIVFGAVLAKHGQLGPTEISGKREFTYFFVQ